MGLCIRCNKREAKIGNEFCLYCANHFDLKKPISKDLNDYIYSTVPEKNIDRRFKDDRHKILDFLKKHKGKLLRSRLIAANCDFPINGTCVEVRDAITRLIEEDGEPIISTAKGYGYATHPNQLKFYAESLEKRRDGLTRRIDAVWKIYNLISQKEKDGTDKVK